MKSLLAFWLALSPVWAVSACAQSVEETVAYIMHGIEDGSVSPSLLGDPRSGMTWRKISDQPLVLHGEERSATMELRVESLSDCVFRDSLSFATGQGQFAIQAGTIVTVDLRNATDIHVDTIDSYTSVARVLDAKQQCLDDPAYPSKSLCSKMGPGNNVFFGSTVRARKALAYLHGNYCKPGNF